MYLVLNNNNKKQNNQVAPTYGGKFDEERFPILETDPAVANIGTHGKVFLVFLIQKKNMIPH